MVIESQTYMVINAAVLILAAIQILIGVKRGFLIQLMDCVGLLLSLFAAHSASTGEISHAANSDKSKPTQSISWIKKPRFTPIKI